MPSPHHAPGEIDTYLGDLTDLEALKAALDGCDAVIHLGAIADVNHVAADPEFAETVNSRGSFNVVEAARQVGVDRVIYGSTIWVYNAQPGLADEDDEHRPPEPPLHRHQAGRRDVLQVVLRAVRARLHDPALRHPVRAACACRRGGARVREEGACGRAAHDRRRRLPGPPLRLRRGPRRRRGALARAACVEPRLQPGRRRDRDGQARSRTSCAT